MGVTDLQQMAGCVCTVQGSFDDVIIASSCFPPCCVFAERKTDSVMEEANSCFQLKESHPERKMKKLQNKL